MKEEDIELTKKVYEYLKKEAERIAEETGEIIYSIDVNTGTITFIEPDEEDVLTMNGLFIKKARKK